MLTGNINSQIISYFQASKDIFIRIGGTFPPQLIRGIMLFLQGAISSRISNDARSATTLIIGYSELSFQFADALLSYAPTTISILNNSEPAKVGSVLQAGCLLSLGCSAIQVAILLVDKPVLKAFGQEEQITDITDQFFRIFVIAVPLTNLHFLFLEMVLSTKHQYAPTLAQTLAAIGTLLIAYPLATGTWEMPALGIEGIAWSFVVGAGIHTIFYSFYLSLDHSFKPYCLFQWRGVACRTAFVELCVNGLPLLLILLSEAGVLYTISLLSSLCGKDALSAQLVINEYQSIGMVPILACASATQMVIANVLTISKKNIIKYGDVGIALALAIPTLYTICTLAIPGIVMSPFIDIGDSDNSNIVNLLDNEKILCISGLNLALSAIRLVSGYAIVGAECSGWRLTASASLVWTGVGLGYGLIRAGYGMFGLTTGVTGGLFISAFVQEIYRRISAQALLREEERPLANNESEAIPLTLVGSQQQLPLSPPESRPVLFSFPSPHLSDSAPCLSSVEPGTQVVGKNSSRSLTCTIQ